MTEPTSRAEPAREVGRLVGIWRYPVKSMAGENVATADVSWHGVGGDRRWAFIRAGRERSGFPWLTMREHPDMCRYRPYFADADVGDTATRVLSPTGDEFDVLDPLLAAELGDGVRVIKQDVGVFDTSPLSIITVQTVEALQRSVALDLSLRRFRPNLVIDAPHEGDFAEDTWVGRTVSIGRLRVRVDRRNKRCMMVNVDPVTSERDPRVLKAIARERQVQLGVYASTGAPAEVSVGDVVSLEP